MKRCHWRRWKACGSYKEIHSIMMMGLAGSASLLICVFHMSLANTVLSSQPFPLSEQACSPPGPQLLDSLSLFLQAGDADLQDKKSRKGSQLLFIFHSYKNFFSPGNFGKLLSETIQSQLTSGEVNSFIIFFNAFWYLWCRELLWVYNWDLIMHWACHALVLCLMLPWTEWEAGG